MSTQIIAPSPQTLALSRIATVLSQLAEKWKPHPKQVAALDALLWSGATEVVLEWGRRTGKGDFLIAAFGIWSQLVPSSQSLYFGPVRKQTKLIMWDSGKIEETLPGNWIAEMSVSNLQVWFTGSRVSPFTGKSDAWLIIDGCDEYDTKRGAEPKKGIVALDEVRELDKPLMAVIRPMLARWNSPLIQCSTPPDSITDEEDPTSPHWVIEAFDRVKARMEGGKKAHYSHATSYDNPHLDREWLEQERQNYIEKGEEDVWLREHMAQRIPKKTGRQFPQLNRGLHVYSHIPMIAEVKRAPGDYEWFALTDPGTQQQAKKAGAWAWNFCVIHKFTKRWKFLHELDTTNRDQQTIDTQWSLALAIIMELNPNFDAWTLVYDEAEAWFQIEMGNRGIGFLPSHKASHSRSEGHSFIRTMLAADMFEFSDKCMHTLWELENYENDRSRDDHIDLIRYQRNVSHYEPEGAQRPKAPDPRKRHVSTPVRDWREKDMDEDWTEQYDAD